MKKWSVFLLSAALWLLMQGVSCRKYEPEPAIYKIDKHIKEWMFFDTGSWWVFRDMKSGQLDSQYITKSWIGFGPLMDYNKKRPYYNSEDAMVYNSSGYCLSIASPNGSSIIEKMKFDTVTGGSTYLRYNPLKVGSRKGPNGLGYSEITGLDPHYTLDNIKYDTMITLLDNRDWSENNDSVEYKVLKGVGIINKRNITKKQEWKLLRYHVKMNPR